MKPRASRDGESSSAVLGCIRTDLKNEPTKCSCASFKKWKNVANILLAIETLCAVNVVNFGKIISKKNAVKRVAISVYM